MKLRARIHTGDVEELPLPELFFLSEDSFFTFLWEKKKWLITAHEKVNNCQGSSSNIHEKG